jgi:hypothetical protein
MVDEGDGRAVESELKDSPEESQSSIDVHPKPQGWLYSLAYSAEMALRQHPRRYKPVAKPLRLVSRYAYRQRLLLEERRKDAAQNAATTPPENDTILLSALWAVEFYTPSTVSHLANSLRKFKWMRYRDGGNASNWLTDQRGRGSQASLNLPMITSGKPVELYGNIGLSGNKGPLPVQFRAVRLTLKAVTPSLTALIACFVLQDSYATELDKTLRRDAHTIFERTGRGLEVVTAEGSKARATHAIRRNIQRGATQWIARYVPGVFTQRPWFTRFIPRRWHPGTGILKGEVPVVELILFQETDPSAIANRESDSKRYVELLGIGTFSSWECDSVDGLILNEPSEPWVSYWPSPYTLTLSGSPRLISKSMGKKLTGKDGIASTWDIIFSLHLLFDGLPTAWAISAFLEGEHSQLSAIRDYAEGGVRGFLRSRRRRIRKALLTAGIDSRTCGKEIERLGQSSYEGFDVTAFPKFSLVNPTSTKGSVDFDARIRRSQHTEAQRLADDQEGLQGILSVTSDIGAASTNIALQWLVIFLAVIAIAVAVWAAVRASGSGG